MSSTLSRPAYALPVSQHDAMGFMLAVVSGFVDTAGFVGLDGLFTAHVTGNLVIAGARLATHHVEATALAEGTLVRLVALPVFALTVASTCLLARRLRRFGAPLLPVLLLMEALLLAAFAGAAWYFFGIGVGGLRDAHALLICGSLGVAAMSVQNVLMREALPRLAPTTVMTGNLTQAVFDLIRLVTGERHPAQRQPPRTVWLSLLGFVSGSAAGAYAVLHVGFTCLFWPAVRSGRPGMVQYGTQQRITGFCRG